MRDELERRLGYTLDHDDEIILPRGVLHTDHMGTGRQNDGLHYVGVPVERGRWTAEQMLAVADLAERLAVPGRAEIRLSQRQNVLLLNIPGGDVDKLVQELESVGLSPRAPLWRQSLVSCTGTQFCNLAVVETKERASKILRYLEEAVGLDTPIMVSVTGCPNSCAQHLIADIGLTGIKTMHEGRKVDAYDMLVGGCLGETPRFGRRIVRRIPADLVHEVIAQLVRNYLLRRIEHDDGEAESFRDFVSRHDDGQLAEWSGIVGWAPPASRQGGEEKL